MTIYIISPEITSRTCKANNCVFRTSSTRGATVCLHACLDVSRPTSERLVPAEAREAPLPVLVDRRTPAFLPYDYSAFKSSSLSECSRKDGGAVTLL